MPYLPPQDDLFRTEGGHIRAGVIGFLVSRDNRLGAELPLLRRLLLFAP
jgi:hypothetical protein